MLPQSGIIRLICSTRTSQIGALKKVSISKNISLELVSLTLATNSIVLGNIRGSRRKFPIAASTLDIYHTNGRSGF